MQKLNGQVAVITGGASGIGLALAHRFAEAGMAVAVGDVEELALNAAVEELRGSGAPVYGARRDVADTFDTAELMEAIDLGPASYATLRER